jgi:Methyltransferase domain
MLKKKAGAKAGSARAKFTGRRRPLAPGDGTVPTAIPAGDYAVDWFTNNVPTWQRLLLPRLAGRPIAVMEVGSYEGLSAAWMLDHMLTHARARLLCVDAFPEEPHDAWFRGRRVRNEGVFARFAGNVLRRSDGSKVRALRGADCAALLKQPDVQRQRFDLVYIDPVGHSADLLEKAVLCFPLLKPGGIMVLDDYTHSKEHDSSCPRIGADAFLNAYAPFVRVLHLGWQVILERREQPLPLPRCSSEYWS